MIPAPSLLEADGGARGGVAMDSTHDRPAVLLVDDEEALLRSVRLVLRAAGIDPVLTESDPCRVTARLQRENVVLALLDITMPRLNGEALLVELSQGFPEVGVIMLTATDDPDTAERCRRHGALDYLVKPVDRARLIAAVRQGLDTVQRCAVS